MPTSSSAACRRISRSTAVATSAARLGALPPATTRSRNRTISSGSRTAIWVVIPLGSIIPEVLDSPFPLQKAHPIIERVVRRHPVLKLSTSNGFVIAQGKFARDTVNADRTAHVTTKLTLKACRPQCLPAGLYKGAP